MKHSTDHIKALKEELTHRHDSGQARGEDAFYRDFKEVIEQLETENEELNRQLEFKKILLARILRMFEKYVVEEDISLVLRQFQQIEEALKGDTDAKTQKE